MEDVLEEGNFSKSELQHINHCRLHLQVTTLSDINTKNRNYFSTLAHRCKYDPHQHIWPKQTRLGQHARRLWKQVIKIAYPTRVETNRWEVSTALSLEVILWFCPTSWGSCFQFVSSQLIFQL